MWKYGECINDNHDDNIVVVQWTNGKMKISGWYDDDMMMKGWVGG